MPPASAPSPDERVYTALFLLSLALRPHPEDKAAVCIDRADLWRLAEAAGVPLGRNRFHAATASLAADADGDGWEFLITVTRASGNRHAVTVVRPDEDADGWDEAFQPFGLALGTATEAARRLGLDTATPLPAAPLLPLQAVEAVLIEDGDDGEDEPDRTCTKCGQTKAAGSFPPRGVNYDPTDEDRARAAAANRANPDAPRHIPRPSRRRRSSWCRACTSAATAAAVARRSPAPTRGRRPLPSSS